MRRIDQLILRAKEAAAPGLEPGVALIGREGDSWTAVVHLHDRRPGRPSALRRAARATPEGAEAYVRAVAAEYPNSRDLPVIIDDLG